MLKAIFYHLTRLVLWLYFLIYHRVSIVGTDRLKRMLASGGGPVILAANHTSYLDPPLVGMAFPGRLRFVAWDHLFDSKLLAMLITPLGAVPVSQEDKSSAASLMRRVIRFIEDGSSVLIFPEGQRSTDGKLGKLEGGTALIAAHTGAPIIPVWIDGTFAAYPPSRSWPLPKKITITFGDPIRSEDLPDDADDRTKRRTLLDRLEHALHEMAEGCSSL